MLTIPKPLNPIYRRIAFLRPLLFSLGLFLISPLAAAQGTSTSENKGTSLESLIDLPIEELAKVKITSIASKTKKTIPEAPAIASVITAQEIENMGATTLEEALESLPGFHVSNSSQLSASKYLIRGISTTFNPQTLVLINGVPITSSIRGDRNTRLGVLPVKMISRIEVIRGPGSALYGADAFAGVVNVVTKTFSDIHGTEIGGQAGTFDTYEAWLLHGSQSGEFKITLMADYRETAGPKEEITEDAQTRLDRLLGTQASLAPGPMNMGEKGIALLAEIEKGKWRLRGSHYEKFDVGTGYGVASALDPRGKPTRKRTLADLTYHDPMLTPVWEWTSQLSVQLGSQENDQYLQLFPPGANLGHGVFTNGVLGSPEYYDRQIHFDNSAFYTGFEKHRSQVGAGYSFQHLYKVRDSTNFTSNFTPRSDVTDLRDTSEISLPIKSRYSFYLYAQDEWQVSPSWDFTGGIRWDRFSDFGSTFNPRAALVWKTTPNLTTKFLYGRAFRAPSFAELYTVNNPVNLGNPNLRPETIEVYEIGWSHQTAIDWQNSFNIFYYDIKDLITFVRDSNATTASAQNFSNQKGQGLELETKVKTSPDIFLTANYSYVQTKDEKSDKPAGDYPNDKLYLRGDWAFARKWTGDAQITWVGKRDRESTDTRNSLPGYSTVDLTLRRQALFEKYDLKASIRNLFDADVREPSPGPGPTSTVASIPHDLPQAGRSAYVELTYRF